MGGRTAHRRDLEMVRLLDDAFAKIAVNPTLVAHAGVPWRNVAVNAPPVVATLDVAPAAADDEEAAEAAATTDQDDDANVIAAPPPPRPTTAPVVAQAAPPPPPAAAVPVYQPPPQRVAVAPPPPRPAPAPVPIRVANAPRPKAKPQQVLVAATDLPVVKPKPVQVAAAIAPTAKPAARLRSDIGEGDIGDAGTPVVMGPKAWTIQIGAFADINQARGQLASYAEKSMDILGQAARLVIPFTGVDGHTLYRARFGPFVEREAREVCSRLTQRGQTCFTVLASSR
ncbi:MAG: SPOR domain-containing protein [Rhizomicrobium sp.]